MQLFWFLHLDEPKASTSSTEDSEITSETEHEKGDSGVEGSFNPHHVTASMLQVLAQVGIL